MQQIGDEIDDEDISYIIYHKEEYSKELLKAMGL